MSLSQAQQRVASLIFNLARQRGLPPARALELVAAAYAESSLNPRATNPSSGAAGLFQLLTPGYVSRARQLGGVYDPRANTLAILGDYQRYWQRNPNAAPGEAARDVERSGLGASFYSRPLALVRSVSGVNGGQNGGKLVLPPAAPRATRTNAAPQSVSSGAQIVFQRAVLPALVSGRPIDFVSLARALVGQQRLPSLAPRPSAKSQTTSARSAAASESDRFISGKLIGLPYQGTHRPGATTSPSWQSNNAVDIALPTGTPIYALAGGRVVKVHRGSGRYTAGWQVTTLGPNGVFYGHLSRIVVRPGQRIRPGQLIGYSGQANGVEHLHLGVEKGDPRHYLRRFQDH